MFYHADNITTLKTYDKSKTKLGSTVFTAVQDEDDKVNITFDGTVSCSNLNEQIYVKIPNKNKRRGQGKVKLKLYDNDILSTHWIGPFDNQIKARKNVKCSRIGDQVFVQIKGGFNGMSTQSQCITGKRPIDIDFCPDETVTQPIIVTNASNNVNGIIQIDNQGVIRIYSGNNMEPFDSSGVAGIPYNINLSYNVRLDDDSDSNDE